MVLAPTHPVIGPISGRIQHSHCSYCGGAYSAMATWPRTCDECGEIAWSNPLPVAVVLVPVRSVAGRIGVLTVRRDIEPARGEFALPGGFIEVGETWQEAAVRELLEETGLTADEADVELFDVISNAYDRILIFGTLPVRAAAELPSMVPTEEVSEWLVLDEPQPLAFPTHSAVLERFLTRAAG